MPKFLSTLSLRRATILLKSDDPFQAFLSTLSLRRATHYGWSWYDDFTISIHALLAESDLFLRSARMMRRYFYPRSPCGERPITDIDFRIIAKISIHALLAESDSQQSRGTTRTTYFYPRSPCGERLNGICLIIHISRFLSTLSLRRATANWFDLWGWAEYFYPRSPCGERLSTLTITICTVSFLSTLSLRRATF